MGGKLGWARRWNRAPKGTQYAQDAIAELPGIVGVCWGAPFRAGRWVGQRSAVCVHVESKRPNDELHPSERIAELVGKIPTDVLEVGRPRACYLDHTDTATSSIGRHGAVTALSTADSSIVGLMSGHVALPVENGAIVRQYQAAEHGESIRVRDPQDGDYIGEVRRGWMGSNSSLDYALVRFPADADMNPYHVATRATAPHRYRRARLVLGQKLFHWSSLHHRRKLVVGTFYQAATKPLRLQLPDKTQTTYADVLVLKSEAHDPFSLEGDSGSLVVDDQHESVGIVLGASDASHVAYVLPIWPLIDALGHRAKWFFT